MMTFSMSSKASNEPTLLNQGQPAPYTGFLLSKETAQKAKDDLIEGQQAKDLNISFQNSIDLYKKNESIYTEKVNILVDQNGKLIKTVHDEQSLNEWTKIGYFIGGVLVTGLSVYGAARLAK